MALESSGMILYVVKMSYQSGNWFGDCWGGETKILHRYTHTHTHTHIEDHFISLVFLRKGRNRTKKSILNLKLYKSSLY